MVALSTTEAEYVSLSTCTKKAIVMLRILTNVLGQKGVKEIFKSDKVCIFNDNQSAVKNANNVDIKERSKHIEVRYHFVKEAIEQGLVSVKYVSTKEMLADILTKSLVRSKHDQFVKGLNLI